MPILYTYSEARQKLSEVLEQAAIDGEVLIKKNGQIFLVKPVILKKSPFDIEGVNLDISTEEIVLAVREGREKI